MNGVLLVHKPKRCTSFDVVKRIKRFAYPYKVGHTGTLDPMATGLLPLTVGEATKITRFLVQGDKRYRACAHLGVATDTMDAYGHEIERARVPLLTQSVIEKALEAFQGDIKQIPPVYSALHYHGNRMYKLARCGIPIEPKAREVRVYKLQLIRWSAHTIELDIVCSAGTYIRSLVSDMAKHLGTVGYLQGLTRTEACGWRLEQARKLENLRAETWTDCLIPLRQVIKERFECIGISQEKANHLVHGQKFTFLDLEHMGIIPCVRKRVVCFCTLDPGPFVLAQITPGECLPVVKILRVLTRFP